MFPMTVIDCGHHAHSTIPSVPSIIAELQVTRLFNSVPVDVPMVGPPDGELPGLDDPEGPGPAPNVRVGLELCGADDASPDHPGATASEDCDGEE